MPRMNLDMVDMSTWTEDQKLAFSLIHKNGVLKVAKPKATKKVSDKMVVGMAAYMWRMLTFYTVNRHPYVCMPVTADWDIPQKYDERRATVEILNVLVEQVLDNAIPKSEWKGIMRWGNALGFCS